MASERINLTKQLEGIQEYFELTPKDNVSPVCDYVRRVNINVSPKGFMLFHIKIKAYIFCLDFVCEPQYNLRSTPEYNYL
ncbi:hypothetical protein [Stenotrophomonas phage RAS14]